MSDDEVIDQIVEDARAEGYARGREAGRTEGRDEQRIAGRVKLAMMSDELRMMPSVVVDAYAELCAGALSDGTEGRVRDEIRVPPRTRGWRTNSSQTETRGLAKASGQKGGGGGPEVKSVKLLALKASIDRKLRKLAREIENRMSGGNEVAARKCSRCGKYGEDNWNWCPWDGAAMQSEDRNAAR